MTIKHQVLHSKPDSMNPPGGASDTGGGDLLGTLTGLLGQASSLNNSAAGASGISDIGNQIVALTTDIPVVGGTQSLASQMADLASQMAALAAAAPGGTPATGSGGAGGSFSSITGMAGMIQQMQGLVSQLSGQLGAGGSNQPKHSHVIDDKKGVKTSAFDSQHTHTVDQNGVTSQSQTKIAMTAPQIANNGNVNNSNNVFTTGSSYASSHPHGSDRRLKSKIKPHPPVLDQLLALMIYTFDKHLSVDHSQGLARPSRGVLADELLELFPDLVHRDDKGLLYVEESKIGILAAKSLQEFVVETRRELTALRDQVYGRGT
jgi:hypothetical protein